MASYVKCIFVLAFLGLSVESRILVKRQSSSDTSKNPGELLEGIQELLGGAASALATIINIKKTTLDPVMETLDRAGTTIQESPLVNTLTKQTDEVITNFRKDGPKLAKRTEAAAKTAGAATTSLVKAAMCGLICPFQPDVNACKVKNKCDDAIGDDEDYGEYGS